MFVGIIFACTSSTPPTPEVQEEQTGIMTEVNTRFNPFDREGESGLGVGWVAVPASNPGERVSRDGDSLRLASRGDKSTLACTVNHSPAAQGYWVSGEVRTEGLRDEISWKGLTVAVRFLDEDNRILPRVGRFGTGKTIVEDLQGDNDWTYFEKFVRTPEGAYTAKLCVENLAAEGFGWAQNLEFQPVVEGETPDRLNVLAIVVDTLRADALGVYGQPLPVSPNIDALAQDAVRFSHAWTQYTWTLPSFASYMTSRYARNHGWTHHAGAIDTYTVFEDEVPTLPEILAENGYSSYGMCSNFYLRGDLGFGRGFHEWRLRQQNLVLEDVLAAIGDWPADGRPNFLYVHLMAPHVPLRPTTDSLEALGVAITSPLEQGLNYKDVTEGGENAMEDFRMAYLAGVRDDDQRIGQILAALEATGEADRTIIVLFSDHGELIGEHELLGHGASVHEELARIPLIVSVPGEIPGVVDDRIVSAIDIAPTLLHATGLSQAVPNSWQGRNLFSEEERGYAVVERDAEVAVTRDGEWKLVHERSGEEVLALYDIVGSGEDQDLSTAEPERVREYVELLSAWQDLIPESEATGRAFVIGEEDQIQFLEQLQALGYVE